MAEQASSRTPHSNHNSTAIHQIKKADTGVNNNAQFAESAKNHAQNTALTASFNTLNVSTYKTKKLLGITNNILTNSKVFSRAHLAESLQAEAASSKQAKHKYAVSEIHTFMEVAIKTHDAPYLSKLIKRNKAAGASDSQIVLEISDAYCFGKGVQQDYAESIKWCQRAIADGNLAAMRNLGVMYYYGKGVEQNYQQAVKCYYKAAAAGNASAINWLGSMYEQGKGVTQDYLQAIKWYYKAIEQGDSFAMRNLASMYHHGKGVEQDYAIAAEWYRKAAELGNAPAMSWLGYLYASGKGVEQDYARAIQWYQQAVAKGDELAVQHLTELYKKSVNLQKAK